MNERFVDLRSDTATRPTPPMRAAMAQAEVGDDVLGEDPTVNRLERRVADILGKEEALFVPSGTMANQIAVRVHTRPGDEMLLDRNAHIYWYEAGAPAVLSGVTCHLLDGDHGIFTAEQVHAELRPDNLHFPRARLIAVENTHNRGGGSVWPLDVLAEVYRCARDSGLAVHMDGARLWNATVASGVAEAEFARCADSVSVCFSKGLGAPVGSALAGSSAFVAEARRVRKQLGGGMRQAGIVAAGALYALEYHRGRMAQDHENALRLAEGLAQLPRLQVDVKHAATNMVYIKVRGMPAQYLVKVLEARGVKILATGSDMLRAVTHIDVSREDVDAALTAFAEVLRQSPGT